MKRNVPLAALPAMLMVLLVFALNPSPCLGARSPDLTRGSDILIVSGTVTNAQGKPVRDVHLSFFINGLKVDSPETTTSRAGRYEAELSLPGGTLPEAKVEVAAQKPSYKSSERILLKSVVKERDEKNGNLIFLSHQSFSLARQITAAFWIATFILLCVYILIAFEHLHRTLAALLGASLMLAVSYTIGTFNPDYMILTFEDAMHAIDLNVIFLLMAMMIIVGIMKKTGVFQWMAYKAYQMARGNVFILASILMLVAAVVSAFLDNVTTMLLIIPVTIEIALTLKISPVSLLIPEVFASNIGGTATLIGDPPNIMIGSYARLSFTQFVDHLSLVNALALGISVLYFAYRYRKDYSEAGVDNVEELIERLRREYRITDKTLLVQGSIILGMTILLFIVHGTLKMEPSIAALSGAAFFMVVSREDIVEILEHEIEWPTLIFFMMLFIVVAGAEEAGFIQVIADWVREVSKGSLVVAVLMILWVSALASAIVDNIPFTATMLPIVGYLTTVIPGAQGGVLWWALSLGACLGGNGTMIGASANVVTVGMAERAGYPVSFMEYFKTAFFPMIVTIILCSAWLLLVEK